MDDTILVVENLAGMQRAFAKAERDVRLGSRHAIKQVAEPIRRTIETRSVTEIRNMPRSPQWARMRTGVTRNLIYIVPRQKGSHGRGPTRRRNFRELMLQRAMDPAVAQHGPRVEAEFEQMLDRMADDFNRGP